MNYIGEKVMNSENSFDKLSLSELEKELQTRIEKLEVKNSQTGLSGIQYII